jgi:hypothetical protein
MASGKQATRRNVRKAQRGWQGTPWRGRKQQTRRGRAKPGTGVSGQFFRIEMAPRRRFITFRYHDAGKKGGVECIAGQRPDRTWDTAGG